MFYGVVYTLDQNPVFHQVILWASLGLGDNLLGKPSDAKLGPVIKWIALMGIVVYVVFYFFMLKSNKLEARFFVAKNKKEYDLALQLCDEL